MINKNIDNTIILLLACFVFSVLFMQSYNRLPILFLDFEPRIEKQIVLSKEDIYWLSKNIYFETRSESVEAQIAVALVTFNRVNDTRFPNNIKDVVTQKYQFSWYWDGLSDNPNNKLIWNEIQNLSSKLLYSYQNNTLFDSTNGSTFYYANYMKNPPVFGRSNKYVFEKTIGTHKFYSIRGIFL